jgi:hypothetical protein
LSLAVPLWFLGVSLLAQDPQAPSRREALERASRELAGPQAPANQPTPPLGAQSSSVRLIDVSLNVLAAAGTSTERDAVLKDLQGGGHDPKKRGFTLQQAELSLSGAVDPWFKGEAHLVTFLDSESGETNVELEEAFLVSQQLPAGLQLKAGTFFTEFGRMNSVHPHAWDWQDQPLINTRLFGGDGMRGPGARLSWLVPTDTYAELFLTMQNASGETMTSFLANDKVYEERPIGGRFFQDIEVRSGNDLAYTLRGITMFDLSDTQGLALGVSAVIGPNATGPGSDTLIYGADFVWRWKPVANEKGYPFFKVQGEAMARKFDAAAQTDSTDPLNPVALPGETLDDYGGYLQGIYGFASGWAAGVRVDWVSGSGESYDAGSQTFDRDSDPFRTDRLRLSPMLVWKPSEFSRFRLQYNYDDSDHLDDPVHSVWLGFEVLIGTHPPHAY